jgi:hypothetical protein
MPSNVCIYHGYDIYFFISFAICMPRGRPLYDLILLPVMQAISTTKGKTIAFHQVQLSPCSSCNIIYLGTLHASLNPHISCGHFADTHLEQCAANHGKGLAIDKKKRGSKGNKAQIDPEEEANPNEPYCPRGQRHRTRWRYSGMYHVNGMWRATDIAGILKGLNARKIF